MTDYLKAVMGDKVGMPMHKTKKAMKAKSKTKKGKAAKKPMSKKKC